MLNITVLINFCSSVQFCFNVGYLKIFVLLEYTSCIKLKQ